MKHALLFAGMLGITLAGCTTPPAIEPAATEVAPPAAADPPPAPVTTELENHHRSRAQAFMQERNWADALAHWELLALLRPEEAAVRDGVAEARSRIRESADTALRAAEQARRQGNLDQATLLYLRVLNVDRENASATRALREMDAERTRRLYLNRPPRG